MPLPAPSSPAFLRASHPFASQLRNPVFSPLLIFCFPFMFFCSFFQTHRPAPAPTPFVVPCCTVTPLRTSVDPGPEPRPRQAGAESNDASREELEEVTMTARSLLPPKERNMPARPTSPLATRGELTNAPYFLKPPPTAAHTSLAFFYPFPLHPPGPRTDIRITHVCIPLS